jgi:KDO2-lipid IV(A) lauroyltransferase
MSALLYYLVLKPLSLLPFWVLYRISDFLYLILYKILGYRVKVVTTNLKNSFPEKSSEEIADIRNKFYHHLCDIIVESIKLFSISEKEVKKRIRFVNPEVTNAYFEKGQSLMIVGGHCNNWEYSVTGGLYVSHEMVAIYSPLSNNFFEKKMNESRSRFGIRLLKTKDAKTFFETGPETPSMMIFGSDQSPSSSSKAYWTRFLNQDTAVSYGLEKYAKQLNYPVIFTEISKVKRGYYEFSFELIEDNPSKTSYGEISEKHVRRLEKQIIETPEYWLWSHKRWKREKPDNVVIPQYVAQK